MRRCSPVSQTKSEVTLTTAVTRSATPSSTSSLPLAEFSRRRGTSEGAGVGCGRRRAEKTSRSPYAVPTSNDARSYNTKSQASFYTWKNIFNDRQLPNESRLPTHHTTTTYCTSTYDEWFVESSSARKLNKVLACERIIIPHVPMYSPTKRVTYKWKTQLVYKFSIKIPKEILEYTRYYDSSILNRNFDTAIEVD